MSDRVTEVFRRGGVAKITLLSGDTLRVPSPVFLERRLREGDFVDPDAYRDFARRREGEFALLAAAKYMETRERSAGEIAAHLKSKAYDDAVIEDVLTVLKRRNLVSDARFSEMWTDARIRKYGRSRVAAELARKGVARETVAAALEGIDPDIEFEQAVKQADKLMRRLDDPRKAMQALARRGYAYDLARRAVALARERGSADGSGGADDDE